MKHRKYAVSYFASDESATRWLNKMAAKGYVLVSSSTCLSDGENSEDSRSQIWLVMERKAGKEKQ